MSDFYPAAVMVHWPSGPVAQCERHAAGLVKLGNFLGTHIVCTELLTSLECEACRNEAESPHSVKA